MEKMPSHDTDRGPSFGPGRVLCTLCVVLLSGAIVHNAVFAQKSRVYPEARVEVNGDATRLDKLFSVLNLNTGNEYSGRTRMKVQPDQGHQPATAHDTVLRTQRALAKAGRYSGDIDGILGERTRDAIRRYQSDNGLNVTGKPDQALFDHLEFVRQIREASAITGSIGPVVDPLSVELVQSGLKRLGYDPGPIDGKMGAKTIEALRSFQADTQLPVDGKISSSVLDRLSVVMDGSARR